MERFSPTGLGWQRDLPDLRDYTVDHPSIQEIISSWLIAPESLPASIDLCCSADGMYLPSPGDQGRKGLSCAFACLGLIEYFHRRFLGISFDSSPFFVYQMTRRIMNAPFNASVDLRTTFKALRRYGSPPEYMCRGQDDSAAELTDISLLGFKKDLEDVTYFRPVYADRYGSEALFTLKAFLASGFPFVMGFAVPSSIDNSGLILWRPREDNYLGGQAVMAVGYDDHRLAHNRGALLIRSSWGSQWGEHGYGWLPYGFIENGLATDYWTITGKMWLKPNLFCVPSSAQKRPH